jgi:hypothetical protein
MSTIHLEESLLSFCSSSIAVSLQQLLDFGHLAKHLYAKDYSHQGG